MNILSSLAAGFPSATTCRRDVESLPPSWPLSFLRQRKSADWQVVVCRAGSLRSRSALPEMVNGDQLIVTHSFNRTLKLSSTQ